MFPFILLISRNVFKGKLLANIKGIFTTMTWSRATSTGSMRAKQGLPGSERGDSVPYLRATGMGVLEGFVFVKGTPCLQLTAGCEPGIAPVLL